MTAHTNDVALFEFLLQLGKRTGRSRGTIVCSFPMIEVHNKVKIFLPTVFAGCGFFKPFAVFSNLCLNFSLVINDSLSPNGICLPPNFRFSIALLVLLWVPFPPSLGILSSLFIGRGAPWSVNAMGQAVNAFKVSKLFFTIFVRHKLIVTRVCVTVKGHPFHWCFVWAC